MTRNDKQGNKEWTESYCMRRLTFQPGRLDGYLKELNRHGTVFTKSTKAHPHPYPLRNPTLHTT